MKPPAPESSKPPRRAGRRWLHWGGAAALGIGFVGASYSLNAYTQSTAFCGETCHRAMAHQQATHLQGLHAAVPCTACHVGSGVWSHLRSKLRGGEHLVAYASGEYSRPLRIRQAQHRVEDSRCLKCHVPAQLPDSVRVEIPRYRSDRANTALRVSLKLRMSAKPLEGRRAAGIAWHMLEPSRVEFRAVDANATVVPWVRVKREDGSETTYLARTTSLQGTQLEQLERRIMGCADCHNRSAHARATPDELLDRALFDGRLSRQAPGMKRQVLEALEGPFHQGQPNVAELAAAIRRGSKASGQWSEQDLVNATAKATKLHRDAIDPQLRTSWDSYPDHLGHRSAPGCFRCHDGQHVSENGAILPSGCDSLCHSAPRLEPIDADFDVDRPLPQAWHPWQLPITDPAIPGHDRLICSDCHGAGLLPHLACESCHHPPGI